MSSGKACRSLPFRGSPGACAALRARSRPWAEGARNRGATTRHQDSRGGTSRSSRKSQGKLTHAAVTEESLSKSHRILHAAYNRLNHMKIKYLLGEENPNQT